MHRIWAFLAGLPVGLLGALAVRHGAWVALELGALAGGVALGLGVWLAGRLASHDDARGAHLARASSVGLAALPASAAAWLGLAPGAGASLAVVLAALVLFVLRAMRASGPAGGALRQGARALAVLVVASALCLAAAGGTAAWRARRHVPAPELARYAYDVDAGVPLAPAPGCAPELASVEEIGAGANPALADRGAVVWYDAPGEDGRRQIHRLDRRSGVSRCWTCGEPGDNRRPRPTPNGADVVFETDRYATPLEPLNWELQLVSTRREAPVASRRLTNDPAPDTFGALDPGGHFLVWSAGAGGSYAVVSASFESGHGGLLLGKRRVLVPGGTAWVAPLAWSPDARTLVVLRGDPIGLQSARAVDPATGREAQLSRPGAQVAAASFSGDGTTLVLATTRTAAAASALPSALGFAVARVATLAGLEGSRLRGTGLRVGPPWAESLDEVPLGEVGSFGPPTGVALEPDGRALVLGQRSADGAKERLVRLALRCDGAAAAPAQSPGR